MSSSLWKFSYLSLNKNSIIGIHKNNKKIFSRNHIITEDLVCQKVNIYNGKDYKYLEITREHVGYKFGEFSDTRKCGNKKKK